MGVDAQFYVRTAERWSVGQMEELVAALNERSGTDWWSAYVDIYADDGRVVTVRNGDRFYGPDYARGPWERIRATGDWLMLRFGETAVVRYGGCCGDGWESGLPWPKARREGDEHWAVHGHRTYHWALDCDCEHCATLPMVAR